MRLGMIALVGQTKLAGRYAVVKARPLSTGLDMMLVCNADEVVPFFEEKVR